MKQAILLFAVLALLFLVGCQKNAAGSTQPTQITQSTQPAPDQALFRTWVNRGAYENGRSYVESMRISPDGTVEVSLEYDGAPYQTLRGSWMQAGERFTVTIDSVKEPFTTDYHYRIDGNTLTLTDEKGSYTYVGE